MSREYLVGIDLGTSNSAVAIADPSAGADAPVADFPVTQVRQLGDAGAAPLLPSAIYIKGEHELPAEAIALPWDRSPQDSHQDIVGEFARAHGSRVPGRLVISAKSWLSHSAVDRTAAILPWGAPADVSKISPVDASARVLHHILQSWDFAHPDAPLAKQEVVITVPASFDEMARALTVNAAKRAGLDKFTLVEEPQAAFYDFIAHHRHDLKTALDGVNLVLVVDIGGGTTDFTLVKVGEDQALRRIAVGDHLMLGGDNMDAAVARRAEERMKAEGKLRPAQWSQLVQASRLAKEALLSERPPERCHVSVVSEGSRMIGGTLSTHLGPEEVEQIVLDGFFPYCTADELPRRTARVALQEFGLPYAQDPEITRHVAAFLKTHSQAGRPDAILLNGGVFNSARIAARFVDVVSSWYSGARIRVLQHDSLELAVARGAAYYALVRRGLGRRIGGGTAHAFYVGLESKGEPKALCIIPRGHEEGRAAEISGRAFDLTLERPVQFPLFTSTSDRIAASGDIVTVEEDLHPLPPIHTVLKSSESKRGSVPVHLRAVLTEIGTLQLWCVSDTSNEQWRLEFELRGSSASPRETVIESMPPRFSESRTSIERIFGGQPTPGTPVTTDIKRLWRGLEQTLGPRDQWRAPLLRELWSALFAGSKRRRRSPDHERIWFQLTGYALRPGFGYPLDEWRAEQTAALFAAGVLAHTDKRVWTEFWIMWRRIAGGLSDARQSEIWNYLRPHLQRRLAPAAPGKAAKPKGIQPESLDEMVRLAVSLEHLGPEDKSELGDWIAPHVTTPGPWAWALGRLGARVPMYGSAHRTVDPERAASWLQALFEAHARGMEGALFAIAQIARFTGDRSRDLDESLRGRALQILESGRAPESWRHLLTHVAPMDEADKARAFGDTLPVGLAA